MKLPRILRNIIAAVFIFVMLVFIIIQTMYGRYPSFEFKTNVISVIIFVAIFAVYLWIYLYLRRILKKKNIDKRKKSIIEIAYIIAVVLITRIVFGVLFINNSLEISELSVMHRDLIDIIPIFSDWYKLNELISNILFSASISVYIVNTIIFMISTLVFRKLLKLVVSSEVISIIGTLLFIVFPKYMYYSLAINLDLINLLLYLFATLLIVMIIKEVKIANRKKVNYITYSVILAFVIACSTYIYTNVVLWIIFLIMIDLFINETDFVKIRVPKKKILKADLEKKAKINKIKSIKMKKILLSIIVVIIGTLVMKIVINCSLQIITDRNYIGYKPYNYNKLFSLITEQNAREEMINSNFKETLDKSTGKYNVGNTLNNVVENNKKGRIKESSKLVGTLIKSINKNKTFNEKLKNFSSKNMDLIKCDINIKKGLYKKYQNKDQLLSILNLGNSIYKMLFIIVLITEIIHFIVRRKKDTQSVTIRMMIIMLSIEMILYASYTFTTINITAFIILILIINLSGIYYNRDDKIKLLNESKSKY